MPHALRVCANPDCERAGRPWRPKSAMDGDTCRKCVYDQRRAMMLKPLSQTLPGPPIPEQPKPWAGQKQCGVCARVFTARPGQDRCGGCLKLADTELSKEFGEFTAGGELPKAKVHYLAPPLKQAVFDLETFSLDRGWGVLMVGSILVHGDGPEPKMYTFDLTESPRWPDVRSDDSDLAARIMKVLSGCHVLYAHNGARYDIPWLNSLALKYGMPRLNAKLIDPVQVARNKYRIGSNSLSSLASFLGLEENKMPVPAEVWRTALFDNCRESWDILRARCESDVRILNQAAAAVTLDVGMIDKFGSSRG